jgi:hypothetical protein
VLNGDGDHVSPSVSGHPDIREHREYDRVQPGCNARGDVGAVPAVDALQLNLPGANRPPGTRRCRRPSFCWGWRCTFVTRPRLGTSIDVDVRVIDRPETAGIAHVCTAVDIRHNSREHYTLSSVVTQGTK